MRKIAVAAVKGEMSYKWYKAKKLVDGFVKRNINYTVAPGDIFGLRKSADGKSTRMVIGRNDLSKVFTPTTFQVEKLLKVSVPLIGGAVDAEKVGLVKEVKPGVKERRINDELEEMTHILKRGADITDIKVRDKRLYFKFKGRPYGVVSDPS